MSKNDRGPSQRAYFCFWQIADTSLLLTAVLHAVLPPRAGADFCAQSNPESFYWGAREGKGPLAQ